MTAQDLTAWAQLLCFDGDPGPSRSASATACCTPAWPTSLPFPIRVGGRRTCGYGSDLTRHLPMSLDGRAVPSALQFDDVGIGQSRRDGPGVDRGVSRSHSPAMTTVGTASA